MCCPLESTPGNIRIENATLDMCERKHVHCTIVYETAPKSLSERVQRWSQRLELLEKIAETCDECFHLFSTPIQRLTNLQTFDFIEGIHHASHTLEHVFHACCILGDINRIISGTFLEYRDVQQRKLDYLRSASRVCHAIAHLFATGALLTELRICSFGKFGKLFAYAQVLSALGYALWTICIVWERHQGVASNHFASDMGIYFGGTLFEGLGAFQSVSVISTGAKAVGVVRSLAGIIHAFLIAQRLLPRDKETFQVSFEVEEGSEGHHHHYDLDNSELLGEEL